ncbi:hypothetical protein M3J09_004363 [Ascochyta lentis]
MSNVACPDSSLCFTGPRSSGNVIQLHQNETSQSSSSSCTRLITQASSVR